MNVNHFVIHHIQKDKHRGSSLQTKAAETEIRKGGKLTEQGKLIEDFISNASLMFDRQRSGKVYAEIGRDGNTFSELLDLYLKGNYTFLDFSTRLAQELNKAMNSAPLATGGYMAIADFTASPRKLLILMIRQEEGYAVDPNTLELRQAIHLDLNTINVGARIEVEDYENETERHLALVRGLKEIAKYFREFLGVVNFKSPQDETEELRTILDSYLQQNGDRYDSEKSAEIKRNVANLICENKDSETSLYAIASLVNPSEPQEFHDFANNLGVSAIFRGDPAVVKGWLRFKYKTPKLLLDFDKGLLDDSIRYYPSKDQLTVRVSDFPDLSTLLEKESS